jgi:PAS domain S-box-containing protein
LRDLTEIFEATTDFVVQTDRRGKVHYLNPAIREALGALAGEPFAQKFFAESDTPEGNDRFKREIAPAVARNGVWLGETALRTANDVVTPVNQLVIAHRDAQGRVERYSAVMRDITTIVEARKALQLQTATLQSVIEAIPAMVAVYDADFRYVMVNQAFEHWRGVGRDRVIGRGVSDLFGVAEYERSWPWAKRALAGEAVTFEKNYPDSPHKYMSVTYVPLRLEDGSVDGIIAVANDITEHREERIRLLDLNQRDALTGLLNRTGFTDYLTHKTEAGQGQGIALLYIDLDRFKPVNDTHGHPVGDRLLQLFAQRLKGLVRPTDGHRAIGRRRIRGGAFRRRRSERRGQGRRKDCRGRGADLQGRRTRAQDRCERGHRVRRRWRKGLARPRRARRREALSGEGCGAGRKAA